MIYYILCSEVLCTLKSVSSQEEKNHVKEGRSGTVSCAPGAPVPAASYRLVAALASDSFRFICACYVPRSSSLDSVARTSATYSQCTDRFH